MLLWLAAMFAAGVPANADAQYRPDVVPLPQEGGIGGLKAFTAVRPDPEGLFEPADLLVSDAGFQPYSPDLEASAPPLWLKLRVAAPPGSAGEYVLTVPRRMFSRFEYYVPAGERRLTRLDASFGREISAPIQGRHYAFDFDVPAGQVQTLLIYVDTIQSSLSPVDLWIEPLQEFSDARRGELLLFGLLFGALIALILHNFILYLNLRQPGHLLYVVAIASSLAFMAIDSGLAQNYLIPAQWSVSTLRLYVVLVPVMQLTMGLFFLAFVNPARQIPKLSWTVRALIVLLGLVASIAILVPLDRIIQLSLLLQPLQLVFQIVVLVAAFMAGRRGLTEGYIFFAAWLVFLLGGFSRVFISLELLPRTDMLEYMMYFGSVIEASVLALGLSWRVRQLHERHARAIEEQHKAARLANLDPLTDAYNRRFLQTYLEAVLPDRDADAFDRAVLILDLDRFKETNDEHGHAAGDYVLRELVRRCQRVLRESDIMCRLGGDEFVIVLADQQDRSGLEEANRILAEVESEPFMFEGSVMPVTTSIGVVSSISPKCAVSDILRMADQALYQAKQAGRNRAVLFDPDKATPFVHGPSKVPTPYES